MSCNQNPLDNLILAKRNAYIWRQRCDNNNNVIDKMGVNYLVVSHKRLCGHGEITG